MSTIVDVSDDQIWVQSQSGKERSYDRRDVLYPDPRIGDEVVVFKDQDGYLVVQLREYFEQDHPEMASQIPISTGKTKNKKSQKSTSGSFFSNNKFGIIGIIVGVVGMFSVIICIAGIILNVFGIIKDRKKIFAIIGIALSCFMLAVNLSGGTSGNTDNSSAVSTDISGNSHSDWTEPEFDGTEIFGRMYYFNISNWDKNVNSASSVSYYPYGSNDPSVVISLNKSINDEGSTSAAQQAVRDELETDEDYTIKNQTAETINGTDYMRLLIEYQTVESEMFVYADSGYVYLISGTESNGVSPDLDTAIRAFLEKITYDGAGDVPLYSDDNITIIYKASDENGMYFVIQNHTDSIITLTADSLKANGTDISGVYMDAEISSQSTQGVYARCSVPDSQKVASIGGEMQIGGTGFTTYTASFPVVTVLGIVSDTAPFGASTNASTQTSTENSSSTASTTEQKDTLLYQDDRVNIYFYSVDSEGVSFKVQNLTDLNLTIQADSVGINGISYNDIIMSDDVAPQSTGIVKAKCSVSVPDKVETVSGQLTIFDYNRTFDVYKASFSNIAIEQ